MGMEIDQDRLKDLIGGRRRDFDPEEPLFAVMGMVREASETARQKMLETHQKTLADVNKLIAGFVDQVAAANVLAENAAKAKAETTVTQAAVWAAEHLKAAGVDAGNLAAGPLREALDRAEAAARRATIAAWIGCAGAVASATVAVLVFFH